MVERQREVVVAEKCASLPPRGLDESVLKVVQGRVELFSQLVVRAQQHRRLLRPFPVSGKRCNGGEAGEDDIPGVDREAVLERLMSAVSGVVEQAGFALRDGHVNEAESGPPQVPNTA